MESVNLTQSCTNGVNNNTCVFALKAGQQYISVDTNCIISSHIQHDMYRICFRGCIGIKAPGEDKVIEYQSCTAACYRNKSAVFTL